MDPLLVFLFMALVAGSSSSDGSKKWYFDSKAYFQGKIDQEMRDLRGMMKWDLSNPDTARRVAEHLVVTYARLSLLGKDARERKLDFYSFPWSIFEEAGQEVMSSAHQLPDYGPFIDEFHNILSRWGDDLSHDEKRRLSAQASAASSMYLRYPKKKEPLPLVLSDWEKDVVLQIGAFEGREPLPRALPGPPSSR